MLRFYEFFILPLLCLKYSKVKRSIDERKIFIKSYEIKS